MSLLRNLRPSKPRVRVPSSSAFRSASFRSKDTPLDIHPEIEDALAHSKPVVALETALVTHGLPYPSSLEVPLALEDIVRSTGSIPATIGIINGRVKIGMERHELERLAERRVQPSKISRRDIAAAIAMKADGGTTCSATLVFAALVGIKVFATGGLGGVHRGGENSLDISADLHELTRCPVGLVSSGVKSILDIRRTLEYLETLGVPVLSYGNSREFPAFFSRRSGHNVPWNTNDPSIVAKMLYTQSQLGMQNGALIAVPVPEEYEAVGQKIQEYVNQAVAESEKNGVSSSGKDATPWLLNRIAELSGGESLNSNIALLKNTASVGGQIAVHYQKLAKEALNSSGVEKIDKTPSPVVPIFLPDDLKTEPITQPPANVIIIGSAAVDITARASPNANNLAVHSTAPGQVTLSLGGVARNIAEASHRVMEARPTGQSSLLISPIGRDAFGHILLEKMTGLGMRTDGLVKVPHPSATCNMVLDSDGSLVGGVADMGITEALTGEIVLAELRKHDPIVIGLDGNLPITTIDAVVNHCNKNAIKVLYEPTSVIKSTAILPAIATALEMKSSRAPITYCTPNLLELKQIFGEAQSLGLTDHPSWWSAINSFNLGSAFRKDLDHLSRKKVSDLVDCEGTLATLVKEGIVQMAINLLPFFQHLIIKCGDQGALVVMCIDPEDASTSGWASLRSNPQKRHVIAHGNSKEIIVLQHFPSLSVDSLANVTGAGDSFVGAFLATLASKPGILYHPNSLEEVISIAQKAAVLTLQSHCAVSPELSNLGKY